MNRQGLKWQVRPIWAYLPFSGIIDYIFCNRMKCPVIPYNTIVKSSLPTEFGIDFSGMDGANPLVLIDNNTQGSGFPLFIFSTFFGSYGICGFGK